MVMIYFETKNSCYIVHPSTRRTERKEVEIIKIYEIAHSPYNPLFIPRFSVSASLHVGQSGRFDHWSTTEITRMFDFNTMTKLEKYEA